MPATPELVRRHSAAMVRLRTALGLEVVRRFDALESYDRADVARFVRAVDPLVQGAQMTTLNLLAAYLSQAAGTQIEGIDPGPYIGVGVRGLTAPVDLWERPFVQHWSNIGRGGDFARSLNEARQRAETLAQTNVQLTLRNASADAMAADRRIVGYSRVLTGSSCAFCAAASTQRYSRAELMPMHSRCDCSVAPIYGDSDPGAVVNRQLLDDLRAQGPDYWTSRHFAVAEDGSLEFPQVRTVDAPEIGPAIEPAA